MPAFASLGDIILAEPKALIGLPARGLWLKQHAKSCRLIFRLRNMR